MSIFLIIVGRCLQTLRLAILSQMGQCHSIYSSDSTAPRNRTKQRGENGRSNERPNGIIAAQTSPRLIAYFSIKLNRYVTAECASYFLQFERYNQQYTDFAEYLSALTARRRRSIKKNGKASLSN